VVGLDIAILRDGRRKPLSRSSTRHGKPVHTLTLSDADTARTPGHGLRIRTAVFAPGMEARRVKTREAGLQRSRQPGPAGRRRQATRSAVPSRCHDAAKKDLSPGRRIVRFTFDQSTAHAGTWGMSHGRTAFFYGVARNDSRVVRRWPLQCLRLFQRCTHPRVTFLSFRQREDLLWVLM
jgi:hypothetical protein